MSSITRQLLFISVFVLFVFHASASNTTSYTNDDGTWSVTWTVQEATSTITFTMTAATATGWVAIGLTTTAEMVNSDAYVGWVSGGTATVSDRYITAYAMPALDTAQDGTNDVTNVQGSVSGDGKTTLTFTRKLVTGDAKDMPLTNANVYVLWAYGGTYDATAGTFTQHSAKGITSINFLTGATGGDIPSVNSGLNLFALHACLMVVSVCVFIFPGMVLARFFKLLFPKWFYIHALTQSLGTVGIFIAFIVIFRAKLNVFTAGLHQVFGVLAFIGFMFQFGLGLLSHFKFDPNRKGPPAFPDKVHWWLGRGVLIWSIITILLGLKEYEAPAGAWVLFIFWLIICAGAVVVLQRKVGQAHEVSENIEYHYQADESEPGEHGDVRRSNVPGKTQQSTNVHEARMPFYLLGVILVITVAFILIGLVAELATSDDS